MIGDNKNVSGPNTVVGANVKLVGTLYDANEITIHGKIEGEVQSDKAVIITETAYIKGPVTADTVQVAGAVHGSITATGKLEILPTGKVYGSMTTKDLSIRSGAIFIGKSTMPDGGKEIEIEETEEKPVDGKKEAEYIAEQ
jgi:cytoskeletal protein CcmA (bactofilin family)